MRKEMIKMLGYFLIFIFNFIASYFIFDESSYIKSLLYSVLILILIVSIDLVKKKIDRSINRKG